VESWYLAVDAEDLAVTYRFLLSEKYGIGWGPDGQRRERFRTWKEAIRNA